jgi:hypothetical protein
MMRVATDGETILVSGQDATFIYGRSSTGWVHQATLPGLRLGAVQGDTAVLVDGTTFAVFERSAGPWIRRGTLAW